MKYQWVLWGAVLVSALWQVLVSHEQRQLLKEWQRQDAQRAHLQQEHSKLLLERGTLSAHNRLDRLARTQLNMTEPKEIQILKP